MRQLQYCFFVPVEDKGFEFGFVGVFTSDKSSQVYRM